MGGQWKTMMTGRFAFGGESQMGRHAGLIMCARDSFATLAAVTSILNKSAIELYRTLNTSERTQTFTTASVASKFQTWTLLTILSGLSRWRSALLPAVVGRRAMEKFCAIQ